MRLARRPGAARRPAAVVALLLLCAAGARAAKPPAFRILSGAPRTEADRTGNIPEDNVIRARPDPAPVRVDDSDSRAAGAPLSKSPPRRRPRPQVPMVVRRLQVRRRRPYVQDGGPEGFRGRRPLLLPEGAERLLLGQEDRRRNGRDARRLPARRPRGPEGFRGLLPRRPRRHLLWRALWHQPA
mmetsp:Transcript_17391/g.60049  ORF Transcript_17391/g.60049 Transcript_17391/m.60049 type:complete len:184 (+) Transcript_17391:1105-1656(+)